MDLNLMRELKPRDDGSTYCSDGVNQMRRADQRLCKLSRHERRLDTTTLPRSLPLLSSLCFFPPAMADITQKLLPELLMEILGHVPVCDVLKFKQVRRNPL